MDAGWLGKDVPHKPAHQFRWARQETIEQIRDIDGMLAGVAFSLALLLVAVVIMLRWNPPIYDGAILAGSAALLFAGLIVFLVIRRHQLNCKLQRMSSHDVERLPSTIEH